MFALTVDRRDSRADAERLDMREHLEACRRDLPRPLVAWDITAGDELQALYDDAAAAPVSYTHLTLPTNREV